MSEKIQLNQKENAQRELILTGNVFFTILKIGFPIAIFQILNQLFRLFDTFMAAGISAEAASMVAYFSQMNLVVASIGSGLAIATALKIGLAYGQGSYEQVRKMIGSIFAFVGLLCFMFAIVIIPGATPFLRFIGTPPEFIIAGRGFFVVEFLTTLLMFFNVIYIAIEKAQGNSKRILKLNLVSMVIKISLTITAVYVFDAGIAFLAASTMASQIFIFGIGIYHLTSKKSEVFRFSPKHIELSKRVLRPIIYAALPIIFSHMIFNLGKTVINTMLISYGPLVVGASGIGGLLAGASTMLQFGMKEAAVTVMTQNRGAGQINRVFQTFKSLILINCVAAAIVFVPLWLFAYQITGIFAINDPEFHAILLPIYRYMIFNVWSFILLTSSNALFLAFGYTKILSFLATSTLFLFRIPLLWLFEAFTTVGSEVAGLVMMYSNFLTIIPTLIFLFFVVRRIRNASGNKNEETLLES